MWWVKAAIFIAILYGISKLTGTQMPEVVEAAFGLFVFLVMVVKIVDWFQGKSGGVYMDDGEPGDDGE